MDIVSAASRLASKLSQLGMEEEIVLDPETVRIPHQDLTCDGIVCDLGFQHLTDSVRVETITLYAPPEIFRALGCLALSVLLNGKKDGDAVVRLSDTQSPIDRLKIEYPTAFAPGLYLDVDVAARQVEYFRRPIEPSPFAWRGLGRNFLPDLQRVGPMHRGVANYDDTKRSELVGFGGVSGLLLMGETLLNLSYPDCGRDELILRWEADVHPGSMRVVLCLPGSIYWPATESTPEQG